MQGRARWVHCSMCTAFSVVRPDSHVNSFPFAIINPCPDDLFKIFTCVLDFFLGPPINLLTFTKGYKSVINVLYNIKYTCNCVGVYSL